MLNGQPVHSLKGIGEKTGKLFEKLGVLSIDDLLAYYPRAYAVSYTHLDVYKRQLQGLNVSRKYIRTFSGFHR